MTIKFISFSQRYGNDIVKLHRSGIRKGFLSTTGDLFLRTLYCSMHRSPHSRVFTALDDNSEKVVGFIACALSTTAMYRHIIFRYGIVFFILLLPNIFKISNVIKILETLFYTTKHKRSKHKETGTKSTNEIEGSSPSAELLSIVVDENARGQKIGKKLVEALERYFHENGISIYKVVTYSKDSNANKFYQSCGFRKRAEFIHHGNVMFEYTKIIEPSIQSPNGVSI